MRAFRAAWGQFDQGVEFGLQVGRGRVAHQALVGFDIDRLYFFQQVLVLVQAEALVPGCAVFGAVIQARQFAHQVVQGQQLGVALAGLFEGCQRALHLGDVHAVSGEGQQQAGAPHQRQAHHQRRTDAHGVRTQTATVHGLVIEHALPGRIDGPMVRRVPLVLGQRQAEPQPAQRQTAGEFAEQRRERLAPTGNALDLQIARQAQQEVVFHVAEYLRPAGLAQGQDQLVQGGFQGHGGGAGGQQATHRLARALGLRPLTVANLPQVQRQLPVQVAGQGLQVAHAGAHRGSVAGLLLVQGPDHAVERAPAVQAAVLGKGRILHVALHAAAPDQDGVLAFQPVFLGEARGDGVDLFGFADDQQEADFTAPEGTVTLAQIRLNEGGRLHSSIRGFRGGGLRRRHSIIRVEPVKSRMPQLKAQQSIPCQQPHQDQSRGRYHPKPDRLPFTAGRKPQRLGVMPNQHPQDHTGQQQQANQHPHSYSVAKLHARFLFRKC
ncbi:hypothetical protein PS639_06258 [Pseudomonas fluorescens]|nr:hypothetical protein PS639_06258 [Pseudomonas fluorescens]